MALDWLEQALDGLRLQGLLREKREPLRSPGPWVEEASGRRLLNLCSNDYLSLASHAHAADHSGAGASRLIAGDLAVHHELERSLADWLGVEETLLFTSGYTANLGALSALATSDSVVISDSLNHASLIDGCRLSRARVLVVPHRDTEAVERALSEAAAEGRRALVVTDAYFSMDGDVANLAALRTLCDQRDAVLFVDEAHSLGVFGPNGRGLCAEAGVVPDVLIGTLGKAFGAGGAFVAGSRPLVRWLWNRARSFVFSTGISPLLVHAALDGLVEVEDGKRTARLAENYSALREALFEEGVAVPASSVGPIVPVILGEPARAVRVAEALREGGILAQAIRPPTVPAGTARLRLATQADHDIPTLRSAARSIAEAIRVVG